MTELILPGGALVFLTSGLATALLLYGARAGWRWIPLDRPNHRSLHSQVVPRCGGLALFGIWLLALTLKGGAGAFAPAVAGVLAVSYIDDCRPLSPWLRLCAHAAAAGWVALALPNLATAIMFVFIAVLITNMTNFMDGANGLVAGPTLVGALFVTTAGDSASPVTMAWFWLAAALAGFLPYNWGKAKMFLGDAGSIPLGLSIAVLACFGLVEHTFPPLILMTFLPLYLDATCTLAYRIARREKIWEAHRQHLYQRLARCGWPHSRIASAYVLATAVCGCIGYSARHANPVIQALIFGLTLVVACIAHFQLCARLDCGTDSESAHSMK